jgi:cell division protein FtsI (penicillin-binding protein 3)
MQATPVQMGAALSAVLNGGTYYQPRLIEGAPRAVKRQALKPATGEALAPMMQYTVAHHSFSPQFDQNAYMVGGKTGTAQIAKPGGGYYEDKFNGTYVGFVGNDVPRYVIVVFVFKPGINGYAGSAAAQPIFGSLARMLINNSYVTPK